MAETISNQEELHIQKPLPGQSSVLAVDPGTTVYLDFPLDQAEAVFQDGDLIFRFENGEQVELDNFVEVLSSTSLFLADGTEVSDDQIMDVLQPEAGEPAAGPAPPSGGIGEYDDYMGDGPDGIDRLGTLGPREFGFTPEEPDIRGLDVDIPGEPPDANPDQNTVDLLYDTDEEGQFFTDQIFQAQGNVLDNDFPQGEVSVIGFEVDNQSYGPGSLDQWVELPSGAHFMLSSNGTYEYTNGVTLESVHDVTQQEYQGLPDSYEMARFLFTDFDPTTMFNVEWTDNLGNVENIPVPGFVLAGGDWNLTDFDGISEIEITANGNFSVESLNLINTDPDTSGETITYTIADAIGATDSTTLDISFDITDPQYYNGDCY